MPAGKETSAGVLVETATCAPPAGAGPPSVTMAVEFAAPPITEPGCKLTVNSAKLETSTSGVSSRYKGTMLFDGVGWCKAVFNGVSYAASNIYPELLCRVTPNAPNYATNLESYVRVDGLHIFGNGGGGGSFRTLMHHAEGTSSKKFLLDKDQYNAVNDVTISGFVYNSANGGSLATDSGEGSPYLPVRYANRQEWLTAPIGSQEWDDSGTTGLPAYTNPAS